MKYNLSFPLFSQNENLEHEIKQIVKEFGSPVYIFHEKEFRKNFEHLCNAFRNIYPRYNPAYSYKTNYTPYICNIVKELGGYAEVVSDMEYFLAKKLGYNNEDIIYNGPCKGDLLSEHLLLGGISNIDNKDEAIRIINLAKLHPDNVIRVGIRVNSDIGANYISRFGVEKDSDDFETVFNLLKQCENIKVSGLHCHISRARGAEAWQRRIDNLLSIADKIFNEAPDFIDVGSGMFAEMDDSLARQFDFHVPSYEEYADIVGGTMARHYAECPKKPILISEPGTTVVARYLSLITTVNNVKTISDQAFVTVDSSYYNAGEICTMKKLPYRLIHNGNKNIDLTGKTINIMGFTCLEQDCIYRDFPDTIAEDDILLFGNVGGYSIVSKPPFIRPNCCMLSHNLDGELIEIKRAETYDDIFRTFHF